MIEKVTIPYTGSTPGADSNTYTLFDSTSPPRDRLEHGVYRLRLKNSGGGTVKGYYSTDRGANWTQFCEHPLLASSSTTTNSLRVRVEQYRWAKFTWVNGGAAQTTWSVQQSLSNADFGPGTYSETDARIKGPLAGTNNFSATVGTTHAVYAVHSDWLGRRVDVTNKVNTSTATASIWLVFGTSSSVEADRTAVVTGSPPAWTGSVKIAVPLAPGEKRRYFVDPTYTHFSVESDEDTNKPTIYVAPSDFAAGD